MNNAFEYNRHSDLPFSFSELENRLDNKPRYLNLSWGEFCRRLSEPARNKEKFSFERFHALDPKNSKDKKTRASEKDGSAWLPAVFRNGGRRSNDQVSEITAFVCDFDNGKVSKEIIEARLSGLEYFAHTTYSHHPNKPKWRVIIPFLGPSPKSHLEAVFKHFNFIFDDNLDTCSKKPSQPYYKPSCPHDAPFESFRGVGELFDLQGTLVRQIPPRQPPSHVPVATSGRNTSLHFLPRPCRDGERHKIFLSAVGHWLAQGLNRERILRLAREWNATNIDAWPDEFLIEKIDGMCKTDRKNHPERYVVQPWDGIAPPSGYLLNHEGVFLIPDNEEKPLVKISGGAWVSARTRDTQNNCWGSLVEWLDNDGRHHTQAVPAQQFHEPGLGLAQELAARGLFIVPGKEKYLIAYLGLFNPSQRHRSVTKLGWVDDPKGGLAYVLPQEVYGDIGSEKYVFQPDYHSPTTETIKPSCSLEEWQQHVAALTRGNPYLTFGLCSAFAAPLLKAAGLDGGGFHLYGRSSQGKTTTVQVAASVWGCGADPAEAPSKTSVRRWNSTHNGLEGLAAAHNDGLLALDEAGTCAAKDFGKVIYDLAGGQGKTAMSADRKLKRSRAWNLLFLSTGEVSARQKIEEEGRTAHSGQLLRMLDIPIGDGTIQNSHGQSAAGFALHLKRSCSVYFGTAGPAFLEALIGDAVTTERLQLIVREMISETETELQLKGLQPEAQRALRRLALVAVAGKLAARFGILPHREEEIIQDISLVRDAWLSSSGTISAADHGVEAVREFILRNPARFSDANLNKPDDSIRELVGYLDRTEKLYMFTLDGFKEACRGHDAKEVRRELFRRQLLSVNESPRHTYKRAIAGLGRLRLYAVKSAILEADDNG